MYKILLVLLVALLFVAGGCSRSAQTKEALFNAGKKQLESQNPGAAVSYFKNALEKDQNYLEARFQLGMAYTALGKFETAEKELRKVQFQRPGSEDVQREIARVLALGGKPDEALKITARLSKGAEYPGDLLEISGWAYALKGDYQTAISLLTKAVESQDRGTGAQLTLIRVYLLMGETREAQELLALFLKKDPANRQALFLLAELQSREKETAAAALKTYDKIIKHAPFESVAFLKKGLLLVGLKRHDEALVLSDTLIKTFPDRSEGYELKGISLFHQKNFKEAIPAFQKTLALEPSAGSGYLLGLAYFYREELEQAINQMQRIIGFNPGFAQARIMTGLLYIKKNMIDEAVDEMRQVVAAHSDHALAHSVLGSACLAKGAYGEGLAALNRALELDPNLPDARLTKEVFELPGGRQGWAETELREAVKSNPELLNSRILLAVSYVKQNKAEKAVATAQEGFRNHASDAVLYNIIADAYLLQHKIEEALAVLLKAKEADPEYDLVSFKMAALHQMAGEEEKALDLLRTVAEDSPENIQAQLAAASLLASGENDGEAALYYERARETGTVEGTLEAARYYLRGRKHEKALSVLDEGIRKNPEVASFYFLKGRAYQMQENFEDALEVYEELERMKPEAGLAAIIDTYLAMNQPGTALDRVRREMKKHPERRDLEAELSTIYIRTGKRAEAAENARGIIERDPRSPVGHMTLAMVHESAREYDKAINVLRQASQLKDLHLTIMLGNLYERQKKYASALEQYGKAEQLRAGYLPAILKKASLLSGLGKKKEAIAEYQRVLKLNQGHVPALNSLACLYAEDRGSLVLALNYAVQAYVLAPYEGTAQDTLGWILLKNGKIDEGLRVLKQAASTAPDNPSISYHLALALKEKKETMQAAAYLQKALGFGDFPEYLQAMNLLDQLNHTVPESREEARAQRVSLP